MKPGLFERAACARHRVLGCLSIGLLVAACDLDCFMDASGPVQIIDTKASHYLVYRVTGFQEKVEYFEVYGEKPKFRCGGKTNIEPIDVEDIEPGGLVKRVELRGNQVKIVYTKKRSEAVAPEHARLMVVK
jgi:hypothetical protein